MPLLDEDEDRIAITSYDKIDEKHNYQNKDDLQLHILNTKDLEVESITNFISGSIWTVDFFTQIVDINTATVSSDINVDPTLLKYNRINNLEIIVTSPLDQTDEIITGEGIINSGIIINTGDCFIASLTGGRVAIFNITSSKLGTYNLRNVYMVNYEVKHFLDTDTGNRVYNDLLVKTMKNYVYDKDMDTHTNPRVIVSEDYKFKTDIKTYIKNILDFYTKKFLSRDKKLLLPPTKSSIYYDQYLSQFIFRILDIKDNEKLISIQRLEQDIDESLYTVYNLLLDRNVENIDSVDKDMGWKILSTPKGYAINRNLFYLSINFTTQLTNIKLNVDYIEDSIEKDHTAPVIKISTDTSYILSNNFYNFLKDKDLTKLSYFERMVINYLNRKSNENDDIILALKEYKYWTTEQQFYLLPILILLLKDTIRNNMITL